MNDGMDDDDLYDMTREFLVEGPVRPPRSRRLVRRPDGVTRVLENLGGIAPEHARIIEQYLSRLELLGGR